MDIAISSAVATDSTTTSNAPGGLSNAAGGLSNAAGVKHKGEGKTARIPIKVVAAPMLRKPDWIRVKTPTGEAAARFGEIKKILREHNLHSVCEEASCLTSVNVLARARPPS